MKLPLVTVTVRVMAIATILGLKWIALADEGVIIQENNLDAIVLLKNENNALPITDAEADSWASLIDKELVSCLDMGNLHPQEMDQYIHRIVDQKKKSDQPVIAVLTGQVDSLPPALYQHVDALIYSWKNMEEILPDLTRILLGKMNPYGRLPQEILYPGFNYFPIRDSAELPNRVKSNLVQFPYGYGKSYSSFTYDDIHLDRKIIPDSGQIEVNVKVSNQGPFEGTEFVQVYLIQPTEGMRIPFHILLESRKVFLDRYQTKEIQFVITSNQLAQATMNGKVQTVPGAYIITAGGAKPVDRSEDLGMPKPISTSFAVERVLEHDSASQSWNND